MYFTERYHLPSALAFVVWNDAMPLVPRMAVKAAGALQPFYLSLLELACLGHAHLLKNWFLGYFLKAD
jgi:hypothetical protein